MPDRSLNPSPPRATSTRRHVAAVVIAGGLALAGAACSPTSTEGTSSTSTTAATSTTGSSGTSAPAEESTYATIADLHEAIVGAGFACTLEYPGLKDDVSNNEVSICTIEDEQAFLTVWTDPADVEAFAESPDGSTGTVAVGTNWTISVTSADLATRLADGLGGTAPSSG